MNKLIQNFDTVDITPLRHDALQIAEQGYQALDIEKVFERQLRLKGSVLTIHDQTYDLNDFGNIYVIGAGKGAAQAATAIEKKLGDFLTDGAVNDVSKSKELSKISSYRGTHPTPSHENVRATDHMLEIIDKAGENDLVITIICGGGSVLFTRPVEGISVERLAEIRLHLLGAGAPIGEINTVYKHLSDVHGGKLGQRAFPAHVLTLAVSDVPHDDKFVIASSPTLHDHTTVEDARATAEKYGLTDLPLAETPNEDEFSDNYSYIILASADIAIKAMADEAEHLGYKPVVVGNNITESAEELAKKLAADVQPGEALIFAGEPTVVVKSAHGKGGRMQHLAVSTLSDLKDDSVVVACASEGSDFINGVAGAIVDETTKKRAEELGIDLEKARAETNSHPALEKLNALIFIKPGVTANVSDFGIALRQKS